MIIGNRPKPGEEPTLGKRYWWIAYGQDAVQIRHFDTGWRPIEIVILKPYEKTQEGVSDLVHLDIRFAIWLPFTIL